MREGEAEARESPEDRREDDDVKVILINRRDIVRRGLHAVIEDSDDLVVVGEAAASLPDDLEAADPDVAIIDAASRSDVVSLLQTLHREDEDVSTLVLDHSDGERALPVAAVLGADGYLADDAKESEVRDAVRRAAGRESAEGPDPDGVPAGGHRANALPDLTYRERQILRLIALGMSNGQIGDRLGLAEKTVKNYVSTLLAKLHLQRRTQAAVYQITHESASDTPDSVRPASA